MFAPVSDILDMSPVPISQSYFIVTWPFLLQSLCLITAWLSYQKKSPKTSWDVLCKFMNLYIQLHVTTWGQWAMDYTHQHERFLFLEGIAFAREQIMPLPLQLSLSPVMLSVFSH